MAGKVITVANQKGGVGKSTTAHILINGLRHLGYKVLAIDLDQQGNLTYAMDAEADNLSTYDLLTRRATAEEIRIQTVQGDLLPANGNLSGLDMELQSVGKEYRLKEAIASIKDRYDYVVIDTPPTLSLVTINALTASDSVLIPVQADIFSLQGLGQLYNTIQVIQEYTNPNLTINGILLTRYNNRTVLSQDITAMLESTSKQLNTIVYETKVREAIAIKEAQAGRTDLFSYAPKSNVAKDLKELVREIAERI